MLLSQRKRKRLDEGYSDDDHLVGSDRREFKSFEIFRETNFMSFWTPDLESRLYDSTSDVFKHLPIVSWVSNAVKVLC